MRRALPECKLGERAASKAGTWRWSGGKCTNREPHVQNLRSKLVNGTGVHPLMHPRRTSVIPFWRKERIGRSEVTGQGRSESQRKRKSESHTYKSTVVSDGSGSESAEDHGIEKRTFVQKNRVPICDIKKSLWPLFLNFLKMFFTF
jgi:hypothetical protein